MTTMVGALDELLTALADDDIAATDDLNGVGTPCVVVSGADIDVAGIGRRQVAASWRLALLAGAWSSAGAGRELATLQGAVLGVVARLDGWAVSNVTTAQPIRAAGSDHLGAFLTVARQVDI